MNVFIDPEMKRAFPAVRLGCLAYQVRVEKKSPAMWDYFQANTLPALKAQLERESLAEIEGIRSSREAYKTFGMSPSRYRVSSESLIRRLRQDKELYQINTVVDANNLISVETALSVGSYDTEKIRGDVLLSVGGPGEGYAGIGKDFISMENMILIRDQLGCFGSPTSDSTRAMIRPETSSVLTLVYCFSDTLDLGGILEKAKKYFVEFAGAAEVTTWIVG